MLGTKSELGTMPSTPLDELSAYRHYPLPTSDPPSGFSSNVNLPLDNPSTDRLISQPDRSDDYRPRRQGSRPYLSSALRDDDQVDATPLLDDRFNAYDPSGAGGNVPYPPSAYTQPPVGYTPPTLRRTATDRTDASDDTAGRTRWDAGDLTERGFDDQSGGGGYGYGRQAQGHARGQGSQGSGGADGYAQPGYGQRGYEDPYVRYEQRRG
jgi:hypothetical protein